MEDWFLFVKFDDKKVEQLFSDLDNVKSSNNLMLKEIGLELTKSVKKRYNQIVAFTSFSEMQASRIGKLESLQGDLKGSYSIVISANYRLIVKPCSEDRSAESLRKCDTLLIEGVLDYHGTKRNWIIP